MLQIAFRMDSSKTIGSGHLRRCLTLAEDLSKQANIFFIYKTLEGSFDHLIPKNFKKVPLNESLSQLEEVKIISSFIEENEIDFLIVDHYHLDATWEKPLRKLCPIGVIDDLANRSHDCDLLIDQNYYENLETRYSAILSSETKKFLGPEYLIIRKEFRNQKPITIKEKASHIVASFGGSDPTNETEKICKLALELKDLSFTVVVGDQYQHKNNLLQYKSSNLHFEYAPSRMSDVLSKADIAIGSAGTTTWERFILGIPTIVAIAASHQEQLVLDLEKTGALVNLGMNPSLEDIKISLLKLQANFPLRTNLAKKSLDLVGAPLEPELKVVKEILKYLRTL